MRFTYTGRRHAWTLCTGDDARDDEPDDTAAVPIVAGAQSADLIQSPPPEWDARMEPYEDKRRTRRTGFTA